MTAAAARPPRIGQRIFQCLLALALTALSLPALAVDQVGGTQIPKESGTTCASNASNCINANEDALGAMGSNISAKETATISQETFNPLCELTFKVVARGASFANTFGWYPIQRDADGNSVKPALSDLHVFLGCSDGIGTEKTLTLPKDVGEIGFFLANNGSGCVPTMADPLGPTLTAEPTNLFFSQRDFNSEAPVKRIHLLVWQSRINTSAFYFGWEDQNGGGDNDFEDLMTYVTGIQCAGGGDACTVDGAEGACADGVMQCRDGELTCVPTQEPSAEKCNGVDDNCKDGIDEGDDLCKKGLICVKGSCQPPCGTGEFRCATGQECVQGVCLEKACVDVECDAGKVCRGGKCVAGCDGVVCPYGATCRSGLCVDVCVGVTCDPGFVCEPRESEDGETLVGVCTSCDCRGCGDGQSCVDHLCVDNACKDQTCGPGSHCVAGDCVDNCADAECPAGQVCQDGACTGSTGSGGDGAGGDGNGTGNGDGGDDGGIIIDPGSGNGGKSGNGSGGDPGAQAGDANYLEVKGCSCELPGSSRTGSAALALVGLLLGAGAARRRRKR